MTEADYKEIPKTPTFKNRIGDRYHRLVVVGYLGRYKGEAFWHCKCDCGGESRTKSINLTSGKAKSCGCWARDVNRERMKTHGHSCNENKRMYFIWRGMLARCMNEKLVSYPNYGGRGITVCERWMDFKNFLEDMGERPSKEYSIDRIDVNGNYEPSNCRWADIYTQANNTTRNVIYSHDGYTLTVSQWADKMGLPSNLVHARLSRGWPFEDAILPVGATSPSKRKFVGREHTPESLREMIEALGL